MKTLLCHIVAATLFVGTSCTQHEPESGAETDTVSFDSTVEISIDAREPEDDTECSDIGPRIVGCPCVYPNHNPFCCTRATDQKQGWICDSGKWDKFAALTCDGNPADCPCPLCPIEWEPEWWSPPPGFDPP